MGLVLAGVAHTVVGGAVSSVAQAHSARAEPGWRCALPRRQQGSRRAAVAAARPTVARVLVTPHASVGGRDCRLQRRVGQRARWAAGTADCCGLCARDVCLPVTSAWWLVKSCRTDSLQVYRCSLSRYLSDVSAQWHATKLAPASLYQVNHAFCALGNRVGHDVSHPARRVDDLHRHRPQQAAHLERRPRRSKVTCARAAAHAARRGGSAVRVAAR